MSCGGFARYKDPPPLRESRRGPAPGCRGPRRSIGRSSGSRIDHLCGSDEQRPYLVPEISAQDEEAADEEDIAQQLKLPQIGANSRGDAVDIRLQEGGDEREPEHDEADPVPERAYHRI